jgi:hypothetical protein
MNNVFYKHSISELVELLTVQQIKKVKFQKDSKKYKVIIKNLLNQLEAEFKKSKTKLNSELLSQVIYISISNLEIWNIKDQMLADKKNYSKLLYRSMELNCIRNIISNNINKKFKNNDQTKNKITFFVKNKKKKFQIMEKFYKELNCQ